MFVYTVTAFVVHPAHEDAIQRTTLFASTWAQVGKLIRACAQAPANRSLVAYDRHPDAGLFFEVTKGADPRVVTVYAEADEKGVVSLDHEGAELVPAMFQFKAPAATNVVTHLFPTFQAPTCA